MITKNVISVIDGAAGSCGKAKVIGEIATDKNINLGAAVTNCMPNAGHTYVNKNGNKTVFKNIPVSCVNPNTDLFIGPGSAIDMETFMQENKSVKGYLGARKIYVHEMVPIIEQRHKDFERQTIKSGSTFKGCGAVLQEKIIRDNKLNFYKTFKNAILCSNDEWLNRLYEHLNNPDEYVVLEGAQGCDLDLNHSGNYPYVTSRNVSTAQLLADSGISPERLLQTIMVIRPFPIRISNITTEGKYIYTGDYGTGQELKWTQINLSSMYGTYPYKGDINIFDNQIDISYLKKLIRECPEIYLIQTLGVDYKNRELKSITLLEALEIERLFHKSNGRNSYETKFLNLPDTELNLLPNTINDLSEQTTVTKMERRIFDLDINKLINNCRINTPSSLYLNFFQHLDQSFIGIKGNYDDIYISKPIRAYLDWLEDNTQVEISALGTGAKNGERVLKKNIIRKIN